jgi:hypothetical protein
MSLRTYEFFTRDSTATWNCVICQSKTTQHLKDLSILVDTIKADVKRVDGNIDQFQNSLSTMQQEFDAKIDQIQINVTQNNTKSEAKFNAQQILIDKLSMEVNSMEVASKMANLVVKNVPVSNNEDVNSILQKLAMKIGVTLQTGDIVETFRVKSKDSNNKSPPIIIVKFGNVQKRSEFYQRYLNLVRPNAKQPSKVIGQVLASDLGLPSKNVIYINEHLSKENRNIHEQAVGLKNAGSLKKVSTSHGYVRVLTSNDKWETIYSKGQLQAISAKTPK